MKVACVIVTHNGKPWIAQCVSSVLGSSYPAHVIVVDSASTDDTAQIVKSFPEVEFVALEQNVGFGVANNVGLNRALKQEAEYVLLLNQDAWVAEDTIEQLVNVAHSLPELGILSPVHWNGNGSALDPNFLSYVSKAINEDANSLVKDGADKSVRFVPFVNAAIWLLPRNSLEKIGGFDPLFFMYKEDNDYCERVKWHNLQIGITPKAFAYHARGIVYPGGTFHQRLRKQSIIAFSSMVFELKNLRRSIYRNILRNVLITIKTFFVSLATLDAVPFIANSKALVQTTLLFGKIEQHRQLTMRIGSHWIE